MNTQQSLLAFALCAAFAGAASASPVDYDFAGTIETGALSGQAFGGHFSFEDSLLAATPDYLAPLSLTLDFDGVVYTLAMAESGSAGISFDGAGLPVGLDAVWGDALAGVVLSSGFGSPYLADTAGNFGSITSITAAATTVPEPASWALVGIAALGLSLARRRKPA